MKKLLPLLLLILIGCSSPEPINMEEMLIERNDVWYTKDTNQPYSGPVFKLYHDIGRIKEQGYLENGKIHGPYRIYFDSGINIPEGGLSSEFNFKNGLLDGPYTSYYNNDLEDLIEEEGNFKDNKRHGTRKTYFYNQQIDKVETYKDGELIESIKLKYFSNGELSREIPYKDGKRDGPYKSYYENGQLKEEGTYKDDKMDGLWKEYLDNGKIDKELKYENYLLVLMVTYFYKEKDGIEVKMITDLYDFNNSGYDGPYKSYYENGQLKEEGTYKDGRRDGPFKFYYDNGQLKQEGDWKDGELIDFKEY